MTTNKWVVRVVRGGKHCADYVGTYAAITAVAALTMAGRDPYLRVVSTGRAVAVTAVPFVDFDCEE